MSRIFDFLEEPAYKTQRGRRVKYGGKVYIIFHGPYQDDDENHWPIAWCWAISELDPVDKDGNKPRYKIIYDDLVIGVEPDWSDPLRIEEDGKINLYVNMIDKDGREIKATKKQPPRSRGKWKPTG